LQEWSWPLIILTKLRDRLRPDIQKLSQILGNSSQPQVRASGEADGNFGFFWGCHPTAAGLRKILNYQFLSLDGVSCGKHFMRAEPAHGYLLSKCFGELTLRSFREQLPRLRSQPRAL
jgi:hypothetical protein